MFIIVSPVGPYFPKGFHPVSLFASEKYVRAFPGLISKEKKIFKF